MMRLFVQRFTQLLRPELCHQLAKESGWCKRCGKISSFEFLFSLVFGQGSALALTLNAQAIGLSEAVSRQAIDQRYTQEAVAYFKAAFEKALESTLGWQSRLPHRPAAPTALCRPSAFR